MSDTTTCGDSGGTKKDGSPCGQPVDEGRCYRHPFATIEYDDDLNERQRRFVEAYMGRAEGNATEAARMAGYGENSDDGYLAVQGSRLIGNDKIREAIAARVVNDPLVADREELQRFFTLVMRGEEGEGVQMKDRLKAAELLGKTRAEFKDKVEHTGDGGGPVRIGAGILSELAEMSAEEKADAFKDLIGGRREST